MLKELKGYLVTDCEIRADGAFCLAAESTRVKDPLDLGRVALFFAEIESTNVSTCKKIEIAEALKIRICSFDDPESIWLCMLGDGDVLTLVNNTDSWESISSAKNLFFSSCSTVDNRLVFAVGSDRKVFKREMKNSWVQLNKGLTAVPEDDDAGFRHLAGFNDSNIYACGNRGDIWFFNGDLWKQINIGTNSAIKRIICINDNQVYAITSSSLFIKQSNEWLMVNKMGITNRLIENIVWYQNRLLISDGTSLFELNNEKQLVKSHLIVPIKDGCSVLSASGQYLLACGGKNVHCYDGKTWIIIN